MTRADSKILMTSGSHFRAAHFRVRRPSAAYSHAVAKPGQIQVSDGKYRGINERSLRASRGAASALAAAELESRLSERFGFKWVYREASKGRVIEGFSDQDINAYSSRHTAIKQVVAGMITAYEAEHGQAPTQRQVYLMDRHAWKETRGGAKAAGAKPKAEPDYAEMLRAWERTAAQQELGTLTGMAARCWDRETGEPVTMTPEAERRIMTEALTLAQSENPVWTRHALVAAIGRFDARQCDHRR